MKETIDRIRTAMGMGPKVTVVGQVDLNSINEATRPKKTTKEERERMRQQNEEDAKAHNREIIIRGLEQKRERLQADISDATAKANELRKQINEVLSVKDKEREGKETRLAYLKEKQAVREKYNSLTLTNDERQKQLQFYGIRPQKMDVVHFHVPKVGSMEEMDGVALVRDENHYYIAVDMYPQPEQEDNATTMMDENPDGTFEGIWPKHVCLKPASGIEEKYLRKIVDQLADDIDRAEDFVAAARQQEEEEMAELTEELAVYKEADESVREAEKTQGEIEARIKEMNAELLATDAELRKYRKEEAPSNGGASDGDAASGGSAGLLEFTTDGDADYEPLPPLELDTPTEQQFHHLPYLRGRRGMTTMCWPQIEPAHQDWLRFRLMANVARLVMMLSKSHALTYVLSEDYYEELAKRGRDYYKCMNIDDVVAHGDATTGVIVYPSQGYQDTIMYRVDNRNQLSILAAYLREDKLMFYESYSMQEVLNHPRTDVYMCQSLKDSGTDPNRLFAWIRNLIIALLAMEHDMERVVRHLLEEGKGSAVKTDIGEDDVVDTSDDHDVLMRDIGWYTELTVERQIPVRGYLSHRWCGSGKDKHLQEVWVRPHARTINVKQ